MAQRYWDRLGCDVQFRPFVAAIQQFQDDVAAAGAQSYITGAALVHLLSGDQHWNAPSTIEMICEGNYTTLSCMVQLLQTCGMERGIRQVTIESGLRYRTPPATDHVDMKESLSSYMVKDQVAKQASKTQAPVSYASLARAARAAKAAAAAAKEPSQTARVANTKSGATSTPSPNPHLSVPAWSRACYARTQQRPRHDQYTSHVATQVAVKPCNHRLNDGHNTNNQYQYRYDCERDRCRTAYATASSQINPSPWQLQYLADTLIAPLLWPKDDASSVQPMTKYAPEVDMVCMSYGSYHITCFIFIYRVNKCTVYMYQQIGPPSCDTIFHEIISIL
jgi:hypothetical protein